MRNSAARSHGSTFTMPFRIPPSPFRILVLAVAACSPVTARPDFAPFPEAPSILVRAPFDRVTVFADRWLTAQGIPLLRSSPRDGYLESDWHAGVKLRCWADAAAPGQSRVTIEAAYRPRLDPSRAPRDLEVPVPSDQEGFRLAERLLAAVGDSLGVIQ